MQPASLSSLGGSLVFASRADLTLRRSGPISRQRGCYGRPAERCGLRGVVSDVLRVGLHTLLLLRHATPELSRNGICHEPGTAAYGATLHYEPFDTLADCMLSSH